MAFSSCTATCSVCQATRFCLAYVHPVIQRTWQPEIISRLYCSSNSSITFSTNQIIYPLQPVCIILHYLKHTFGIFSLSPTFILIWFRNTLSGISNWCTSLSRLCLNTSSCCNSRAGVIETFPTKRGTSWSKS